ncbi:hypothetical protein P280DRAFT_249820 [Massarina eburnea CBS 473.64]|uniref:Uncharacterized protein n=1 Tax=Massarina eburnea CBS 473.64 TaxID=1395130 RepID=A0A6A6S615_9PLEO|nr:hypothetical protein P280DRAFT_249820 [Massarina eburnea CBS 473.64]
MSHSYRYVRMSRNFVNLGNLYKAWNPPQHILPHDLASPYATTVAYPTGWGYFDDGSIYVNPVTGLSHEDFEAEMRALRSFVKGPSPKIDSLRRLDPDKQRLLVVLKEKVSPTKLSIMARNFQDESKAMIESCPFEHINLTLNKALTHPASAEIHPILHVPPVSRRKRIRWALRIFRGTLIDGVLQPNVRQPNGLLCEPLKSYSEHASRSSAAHSSVTAARRSESDKTEFELVQNMQQEPSTSFGQARTSLRYNAQVLKWKHRYLALREKVATAQSMVPRRRPRRTPDEASYIQARSRSGKAANPNTEAARSTTQSSSDPFSSFDLQNPAPPASLAELRRKSRMSLPSRATQ